MAVNNVEDFAEENGHELVTVAVVSEQAESAGMGKFMRDIGSSKASGKPGLLKRLFGKSNR
jgi:hypothetical protein